MIWRRFLLLFSIAFSCVHISTGAIAAVSTVDLTVNMSEAVNVDTTSGTPSISVDVGGVTRQAAYTSGTGTSALTFRYTPTVGDVDLDGISVGSTISLNSGTISDLNGNPLTTFTFTPPTTTSVKVDYPSLSMDFTNGTTGRYTLNGTAYTSLSSFLAAAGGTFTRSSVGTYYDSSGVLQTATSDTPRLDYDPVSHTAKGLLLEESRTNIVTRSSEFENAAWNSNANGLTVTANAATAADGTLTADKLVETATNTHHRRGFDISGTAGNSRRFAIYVKAGERTLARGWSFSSGNVTQQSFDLANGTASGTANPTITAVGNGWYRCAFDVSSNNNLSVVFGPNDGTTGSATYNGDGVSGIYVWGAQLELGSTTSSYIPTTTASVTRAADTLSVPTGTWFDSNKGSIAMTSDVIVSGSTAIAGGLSIHATGNNGYSLYKQAATTNVYAAAGTGQVSLGTVSANTTFNAGMTYTSTSAIGALNGTLSSTFTPASVTTPTTLDNIQPGNWKGHVMKYRYYPLTAANAQLQLLTQ